MKSFNVDHVVSVEKIFKEQALCYGYMPEKKFLGIVVQRGGFYDRYSLWEEPVDVESLDKERFYVEGTSIFYHPHLVIRTTDRQSHKMFFKSAQELGWYIGKSPLNKLNLVELK